MIQQEKIKRQLRNYEVSIWSLQDDFITVLKAAGVDNKGQIQEPEMTLNVDGTQEFSFKIPMYLYVGDEKQENPAWYNYINGIIIANMRKIKIILNKKTKEEEVYEFLITKVTESHEKNELMCSVECEGLAFHELGKVGYKVSLSADDFYNDDLEWFENNEWTDSRGNKHSEQPLATLQYWVNKFLLPYPENDQIINSHVWYYQVQMDWSSHTKYSQFAWVPTGNELNYTILGAENSGEGEENPVKYNNIAVAVITDDSVVSPEEATSLVGDDNIYDSSIIQRKLQARSSEKIYEDEYVASWETSEDKKKLIPAPDSVRGYVEKARMVDLEESNKYNLTQDIAEAFGVYCKYEYVHDEDYRIIARKVIFYNNFIEEDKGAIDINYKYNTSSISREMDSSELVTKMFIRPVDAESSPSGYISIMDSSANKMGEDYLFNFDYLYSIGAIDQQAYDYIQEYEVKMHDLNNHLIPIQEQIVELQLRKPDAEAREKIHGAAIQLDQERIQASDDLLNNLTQNTGMITIDSNPKTGILLDDSQTGLKYLNITDEGVIGNTIHIFPDIECLGEEIKGTIEYDDFGSVNKITNISYSDSRMVYLKYKYSPKLYYEKVKQVWTNRLARDTEEQAKAANEVVEINTRLETLITTQEQILLEKQALIEDLEVYLGPALREGYWQPEDYTDYGNSYSTSFLAIENAEEPSGYTSFIWDEEPFDGEQKIEYQLGADTQCVKYPMIDISNCLNNLVDEGKIKDFSFLYYDVLSNFTPDPMKRRAMGLGSLMQFGFVKLEGDNNIIPILILTGAEKLSDDELSYIKNIANGQPVLGKLSVNTTDPDNIEVVEDDYVTSESIVFLDTVNKTYVPVYPRIKINSMSLKTSDDELGIKYCGEILTNYEDYYILSRVKNKENNTETDYYNTETSYYITLKPEVMIRNQNITGIIQLRYSISNADTAIYLDALDVLKDSAYPQVSYEVDVAYAQIEYIKQISKMLNRIVHINDNDLKFENVQGYVSVVTLDLDHPWNDKIEVKNYKTKFEDLFTKIVASTEQMKKNEYITGVVSQAFSREGDLNTDLLQDSVNNADLNYSFNNGNLTIDNANGIWGSSESGVVAFRGGGIFTATEKDANGDWKWNTGILPEGINADLITVGQIDTNRIKIYAGDQLKFQWNGDGLFAYESYARTENDNLRAPTQYVKLNEDGLFLIAEKGANIKTGENTSKLMTQDIQRVSLNWEGLTLRNYENEEVFYANAETGDLTIKGTINATAGEFNGTIHATAGYIGSENGWIIGDGVIRSQGIIVSSVSTENGQPTLSGSGLYLFSQSSTTPTDLTEAGIKLYNDDVMMGYFGTPININGEAGKNIYFTIGDNQNYLKFYTQQSNNTSYSELEVKGKITATSGEIGGWNINEQYLGTAEDFGQSGTYLGVDGISFGKGFQVLLEENNDARVFKSLIVGATNDEDYIMKIGKGVDGQFELDLRGVSIAEGSLPSSIKGLAGKVYWTTFYENNNPIFDEDAPLGALGILYTDSIAEGSQSSSFSAAASPLSVGYLPTTGYGETGHYNETYFDKTYQRWNVSRGSTDGNYVDNWSRAGIRGSTSNKSATYATLKVTNSKDNITSITVNFKYCLLPKNASWDTWSNNSHWGEGVTHGIAIQAFSNINSSSNAITEASNFVVPDEERIVTAGKVLDGSITLTVSDNHYHYFNNNNNVFYIAFYPANNSETNTLIYIDQNTVSIGEGTATTNGQIGLYIKTAISNNSSKWQRVFYTTYEVEDNNPSPNNDNGNGT